VSAQIIVALQTLVSREVSPSDPAVVHVGMLTAGTAGNVMPESATMRGTIRSQRPDLQEQLVQRVTDLARGIATAMRASAEVEVRPGGRCTINDPGMSALVGEVVRELLGPQALVDLPPGTNGEDFADVLERVPGAWIRLGIGNPAWDHARPHHSPQFDLDESALPIGVAVLTGVAMRFLAGQSSDSRN
jgi:amidohydrolase